MFSGRLAQAIERRAIKKSSLARAVGITPGTLSRYLGGQIVPDQPVVLLLAQHLGVSLEWLRDGVGAGLQRTLQENPTIARETEPLYRVDAVSLVGLDVEERRTVLRMLEALRSGDAEVRQHLIGQLKIIQSALLSRRQQPRAETKDGA